MFSSEFYDSLQAHFSEDHSADKRPYFNIFSRKHINMKDDQASTSTDSGSITESYQSIKVSNEQPRTAAAPRDESASLTPSPASVKETQETENRQSNYGWRFRAAFGCLCLINLMTAVDATILVVALPPMASELQGTAIEAFWTGTSFLLTSTVFQPFFASLSHIIGRKPIILIALSFFTVGSIVATAANSFAILILGRSIQGIGGGGLTVLTYVVVADMIPLRERGKWFSLISFQWVIGSIAGPVMGGVFVEKTTWRWIFILNFPFCLLAFIGIPILLKLNYKGGSILEKLKAIDWIGAFLFIASLTTFLVPLSWGGVMFSWLSWNTLVPLILGVVGLITFVIYSWRFSVKPLIQGTIFTSSTAIAGYHGSIMSGMLTWSYLYYMPLYYEVAKFYSPIVSSIAIFPISFTAAPAAVITGLIVSKTGKYRPSVYLGWVITTLGFGLLILLDQKTTVVQFIFLTFVVGSGTGIIYSAQSFAVQASASDADVAFAAAMFSFFKTLGQTLGVAISGVIFQNIFKSKLAASPLVAEHADEWARDASALVQVLKVMPAGDVRDQAVEAYVQSLKVVWIVMCVFSAVTMLSSFAFIKELSLDRKLETDQGWRDEKIGDEEEHR